MDRIYENFVERVARGRKLPPERVREIARGRVWTGTQAKALGLVDELGGFYHAVERAKTLAKLEGDVRLRRMTPSEGALEALERTLGVSASSAKVLATAAFLLDDPRAQAVIDQVAQARLRERGGNLLAPTPGF